MVSFCKFRDGYLMLLCLHRRPHLALPLTLARCCKHGNGKSSIRWWLNSVDGGNLAPVGNYWLITMKHCKWWDCNGINRLPTGASILLSTVGKPSIDGELCSAMFDSQRLSQSQEGRRGRVASLGLWCGRSTRNLCRMAGSHRGIHKISGKQQVKLEVQHDTG